MILGFIRKFIILTLFVGCGYTLYLYGMSDVRSEAVKEGKGLSISGSKPLRLSSDALVSHARALTYAAPDVSEEVAILALSQDPSSGRAATHLLSLYESQGRTVESDQIAELSSKLWPSHKYTRSNLADYWSRRSRPDKMVSEWNVLLTRDASFRKRLFPALIKIVESDELLPLISPFISNPPVWWNSFFGYLSSKLEMQRLQRLYRLRLASEVPLSLSEQNSYVRRLIKEDRWEEANDVWFLGLTPNQMRYSGLVYDGGFESNVFNQGFGWALSRSKNPRIKIDVTYGIKGRKALQVVLRKQDPVNFKHVWQRLLLTSGNYELTLRYRSDTLKTTKGLSWRIHCIKGGKEVLGESAPIVGSNSWSTLTASFTVPESCAAQMIRLESTSPYRHDHFFQGSAWFDDVRINTVDKVE